MKFQLFLKADNLPSPNGLFRKKPHTYAVISNVSDLGSVMGIKRHRVGVTEVVPSNGSPQWASALILDYLPHQRLAIDVLHTKEQQMKNYEKHDRRYQGDEHRGLPIPKDSKSLTAVIFVVDDVLKSPDGTCTLQIPGAVGISNSAPGTVTACIEMMKEDDTDTAFRFHLRGHEFPNMRRNFMERPDYFFEIYRKQRGQLTHHWALVYRSVPAKGTLHPFWVEDDISVAALCNHDLNRELRIRVVDIDGSGGRHELGSFETNVHGIMGAVSTGGDCDTTKAFQLTCPDGVKKLGQVIVLQATVLAAGMAPLASAVLADFVEPFEVLPPPTTTPTTQARSVYPQVLPRAVPATVLGRTTSSFQGYDRTCAIDLCMAIDFTDKNGDYRSPNSEHYQSSHGMNNYEWVMSVVGETIRTLNRNEEYPMWGFGGSFQNKTYPIFQCGSSPKARGVQGMLDAYHQTFKTAVMLGKERKFDKILAAAASHAKKQLDAARARRSLSYTLLTVLTVGDDSDVLTCKETLVSINGAPLSVLFVPIGTSSGLEDQKLQMYLANRSCRRFCSSIDNGRIISQRNARQLSDKIMSILHDHMPTYFARQGIPP